MNTKVHEIKQYMNDKKYDKLMTYFTWSRLSIFRNFYNELRKSDKLIALLVVEYFP